MKLTREEREDLSDFLTSDTTELLFKEMRLALDEINTSVVNYSLETGTVEKLVQLKARSEGAALFFRTVKNRLDAIRRPKS